MAPATAAFYRPNEPREGGLSQEEAADLFNTTQATWSRWESGVWRPTGGARRKALETLTSNPDPEKRVREEWWDSEDEHKMAKTIASAVKRRVRGSAA